jgi:hypothetical protein
MFGAGCHYEFIGMSVVMVNVVILSVVLLNVVMQNYVILSVIVMNALIPNVVTLNVIMQNDAILSVNGLIVVLLNVMLCFEISIIQIKILQIIQFSFPIFKSLYRPYVQIEEGCGTNPFGGWNVLAFPYLEAFAADGQNQSHFKY